MDSLIEQNYTQIKQYLIEMYGEPKEDILMGRKHIVRNEYLLALNQLLKVFYSGFVKFELPIDEFENELIYVMEYCKDAQYGEIYFLARIVNSCNIDNFKRMLCHLRESLLLNLPTKKVYNCIMNSKTITFHKHIIYNA